MHSSEYVMPLLCFIVSNYEIHQSESEVHKLDTRRRVPECSLLCRIYTM